MENEISNQLFQTPMLQYINLFPIPYPQQTFSNTHARIQKSCSFLYPWFQFFQNPMLQRFIAQWFCLPTVEPVANVLHRLPQAFRLHTRGRVLTRNDCF